MNGPQDFHIGAGSLSVNGEDVGLTTQDGVIVHYKPDMHMHTSGKYGNTPVKASIIGMELTLEITMAEHTRDNIARAYAGVVAEDGKILFGGLAGREVEGQPLVLTPFDGTEPWHFRNAVPTSATESNYSTKNERLTKVTFTALVDMDAEEASNLGYLGS